MKPILFGLLLLMAVGFSQKIVCRPQCDWRGTQCIMVCEVVPF